MNKIIYSLQIMLQLVEKGHVPISTMPNPKYPKYMCWVFECTSQFKEDLDMILGGENHG